MIPISGRGDVIAQWFSSEYISAHRGLFGSIEVGPDEALLIIKDGKPEKIYTQTRVRGTGNGFLNNLAERLSGTSNQILMVSLRQEEVAIPMKGYTADRTEIKGVINVVFRVSKDNILKLANLYKRELVTDEMMGPDRGKVKDITVEDIAGMLSYDTNLTVDASVLSKMTSDGIRGDLEEFNARVRNAVDSMTPRWAGAGLAVDLTRVDVTENAYEDVMRRIDEMAKAQLLKSAEWADRNKDTELKIDADILFVKKDTELRLAREAQLADVASFKLSKEMEAELQEVDHACEVERRRTESEIEIARRKGELGAINEDAEGEIARKRADTEAYVRRLQIATDGIEKDADVRRQIELMNASKQIEIEKAFNDGFECGKKQAADNEYNRGLSEGQAKAYADIIGRGFSVGASFNGGGRRDDDDKR